MVQTRAAAKRIESGHVHNDDGVPPQDTAVEPLPRVRSPTKKRRRDGAEPPKKRRRGKPGELCQLNLDVLFLFAAYVHPIDLLNLARTCKSLRELLMDKSSAFIWKAARGQVRGLPDCPADLTEPEYANLVFYARCHGCGKYAKTILWTMRRRYCPDCRIERLCYFSSCDDFLRRDYVLATETVTIDDETATWVDKEQMESFMQEYNRSSDKEEFLCDKRLQLAAISNHAHKGRSWQKGVAAERKVALQLLRYQREESIFNRLEQHGYKAEIAYFGQHAIQQTRRSLFKTSKPLTDKEWARIWPEWLETLNNFRSRRLDIVVYRPRRDSLVSEYATFVMSPSPDTPAFDMLPHVTDLARFPPIRDIIKAPEGTQMNVKIFESAFAQLPPLVDEWKEKIDAELAELVKIPSHLSVKDASGGGDVASSSTTRTESSPVATNKLRLACAAFLTMNGSVSFYPDVFSLMPYHTNLNYSEDDSERTVSIRSPVEAKFLEDAPYIVHACGLDPNVATVEDMDRRDARVKCLSCAPHSRSWRDALRHFSSFHQYRGALPPQSPRWEIISDEHMDAIRAAELKDEPSVVYTRCLLCRPCAGDADCRGNIVYHLINRHNIDKDDIKRDVHYAHVGINEICSLKMVEEGGQVMFKHL